MKRRWIEKLVRLHELHIARGPAASRLSRRGAIGQIRAGIFTSMAIVLGPAGSTGAAELPANVDAQRVWAEQDPANWITYGRAYNEQRYSPLAKINDKNANQLGLAWFADLDTNRAQEATPLVVDGVMYITTAWSLVKAFDARSGRLLWAYDPEVPCARRQRLLRCGKSRRRALESQGVCRRL